MDVEKNRAAADVLLNDGTGLRFPVDNLEATGRRNRAIEAILQLWLVVIEMFRKQGSNEAQKGRGSQASGDPHRHKQRETEIIIHYILYSDAIMARDWMSLV